MQEFIRWEWYSRVGVHWCYIFLW